MKKHSVLYILFLISLLAGHASAQVSHGGRPLPLLETRSSRSPAFEKMPHFDVAEQLRIDSLCESDLKSGYRFAYKFMTDLNRGNSGSSFILPDGTKVWRLGIYSPGALSINVLFTEYELPEGAQLFLYDPTQSQVLGSFNHLNNSQLEILPVAPIAGERLVIEYQEPANAAFPGRLTVGEVNHAYRDLRGIEPGEGNLGNQGIPALACYKESFPDYETWGRSVVLMIIDGSIGCTGVLLNNTANDGKPYLLTASHCLNNSFNIVNPDYAKIAGSIVCFFNYDSPLCDPIIRGAEEMSTASSHYRAVNEIGDMALLELLQTPPAYYKPYYAGWNAAEAGPSPYAGIHHPQFSTKRFSLCESNIELDNLQLPYMLFYENAFWKIPRWDVGYTNRGSSGSPLFNANGEVIGALSAGESNMQNPEKDYYYAISQVFVREQSPQKQLKQWLSPTGNNLLQSNGLDPYASSPCIRLSNVRTAGSPDHIVNSTYPGSETQPLFGNNDSGIHEFAEAYNATGEATLYGAYFVTPPAGFNYRQLEVEVTVYEGTSKPTTLLYTEIYQPAYTNKSIIDNSFQETPKSLNRSQESYINFTHPVRVSGTFYIGYRIKNSPENTYFSAYNLPVGQTTRNTAWIRTPNGWTQASEYAQARFNTSLFIDPVIRYGSFVSNEKQDSATPIRIYQGADRGTIHISMPTGMAEARYTIVSTQGKIVGDGQIKAEHTTINLPELTPGIYLITVNHPKGNYTEKMIF